MRAVRATSCVLSVFDSVFVAPLLLFRTSRSIFWVSLRKTKGTMIRYPGHCLPYPVQLRQDGLASSHCLVSHRETHRQLTWEYLDLALFAEETAL